MKRELKAYKVTHPEAFHYYGDYWNDPDQYGIIYGKTQREALNKYCMDNTDTESYFQIKKTARTRRFKEADLYSQEPSKLLNDLSKKEVTHLTHSLGIEVDQRFKGEFYRNYSVYYHKNKEFDNMIELGLFKTYSKLDSFVYKVTDLGKEAVKTLLLITIQ